MFSKQPQNFANAHCLGHLWDNMTRSIFFSPPQTHRSVILDIKSAEAFH